LGADKSLIDRWMPLPPIVIFAGHMIDQPDRPQPRFPEVDCPIVLAHIETRLEACAARVGYSSAACGADILFLEAMKMRGGETHIVLPCSIESFRKQSVRRIGGESWVARFDQAIKDATTLTFSGLHDYTESPAVFEFANRELFGLARLKSRLWEIGLAPLAVWNGESGDGPGGTSACLKMWTTSGLAVDIIPVRKTETDDSSLSKTVASEGSQEIKAILFADVVGYSQLPERDTPRYGTLFLGGLARLLGSLSKPPLAQNTWGDAVYLVFESTAEAGECALRLRRFIQSTDWQKEGLSRPLNIRIGLHAGPVFPVHDFITGRRGYMGAHVNRAARIEPVAAEGQIYASEPFAALAETEKTSLFSCVYVGEKALPKDAGIIRVYSLIDRAG
jgi:class 3 adenylate cyclase